MADPPANHGRSGAEGRRCAEIDFEDVMAALLEDLTAKVEAGEPLSDADIATLRASRDIITLGMLASIVRRKLHGNATTYLRVVDLKLDEGPDGIVIAGSGKSLPTRFSPNTGEVRIFQTPKTLNECVDVVSKARDMAGTVPLAAFCLYELGKLPEGLPVVLAALRKEGLEMLAQAPIDRLSDPERDIEALTDAGLQLTRLTVNDTPEREWTDVCRDVAALQTSLQSINVFAPLARKIDSTRPTTGYEDVKRIAIARVVADNVETIQVDWALYGPKLAQVALTFGADDIDSVSADDDQSQGRRRSPIEEIRRNIRAAGFEPIERDGRFRKHPPA
jgi:aminodeoxyfutalosine synthase